MIKKLKRYWPPAQDNGFNLLVAYLGFSAGLLILSNPEATRSIEQHLPLWVVLMWGAELTIGCGLILIGLVARKLLIEKAGLVLLLPASTVYVILLFTIVGPNQIFNGLPYLLFIYACLDRMLQIQRIVKVVTANA